MARDYGKVSPRFWTGETGRKLRKHPEAQTLALYLITAPGSTMTGIYYLAIPTAAHETGLTIPEITAALDVLAEIGFAQYDEPNELVWVPSMAAWQIDDKLVASDKRVLGVKKEILFHQNHPFVVDFWGIYGEAYCLGPCPFPSAMKGLSDPMIPPSKDLTKALGSQEQDQEQEQEQESPPPAGAPAITGATGEPLPDHDDPLRPEKLFARAMARREEITPHFLGRMFGLVRQAEIKGALEWVVPRGVEKSQSVADACERSPEIKSELIPTMRLIFAQAKAGIGDRATDVIQDPSFAFGCWCSTLTKLQEVVHGVSPKASAARAGPRTDVRVGHARAETARHQGGERKL